MDPEDYWARLQEFDKARKLSYNGLIANIKLLNRYCKLDEIDPSIQLNTALHGYGTALYGNPYKKLKIRSAYFALL